MAVYIRYAVYRQDASPLCARFTPKYFTERQKKQATEYAKTIGSHVIDLLKGDN